MTARKASTEASKWIDSANHSIAAHERNIVVALYRSDYTTADKLRGYVDALVKGIAKAKAETP